MKIKNVFIIYTFKKTESKIMVWALCRAPPTLESWDQTMSWMVNSYFLEQPGDVSFKGLKRPDTFNTHFYLKLSIPAPNNVLIAKWTALIAAHGSPKCFLDGLLFIHSLTNGWLLPCKALPKDTRADWDWTANPSAMGQPHGWTPEPSSPPICCRYWLANTKCIC